jgi:hypothetical protein
LRGHVLIRIEAVAELVRSQLPAHCRFLHPGRMGRRMTKQFAQPCPACPGSA